MESSVRSFIAIDLHPFFLKIIENTQHALKKLNCKIKWVSPSNIHITLKFLGDIPLDRLDAIKESISLSLQNFKPNSFYLTQLGAFPSIKKPRILWVGLTDTNNQIKKMAQLLEENIHSLGIAKEEKEFHPHITLGRTKTNENIQNLSLAIKNYPKFDSTEQTYDQLTLYKSTLTPQGPIYESLKVFPLTKA